MPEDAVQKWRALVDANPRNELATYSLAKAHFDRQEWAPAADYFERAIALKADWMLAYILRGKALLKLARTPEAKQSFERALELAIAQHHEGPEEEVREILADLE